MKTSLLDLLNDLITAWAAKHWPEAPGTLWVQSCQDERFGHFQTNIAMAAAKALKRPPREIASEIVSWAASDARLEPAEIAGPGFVNFRYSQTAIEQAIANLCGDSQCGLPASSSPKTIVLDFSGPNVAKEMHVGHIRSTILGDVLARMLSALGHHVIRDNHLGDWGTQFGKMLLGYKMAGQPPLEPETAIAAMQRFYQETHEACEKDEKLLEQARQELVKLQDGDPENTAIWKRFRELSQEAFDSVYKRLDIHFDHTLAESFYNPWLQATVQELLDRGIARESEGAVVVFFDDIKELSDKPFLIRKSDGAALYSTTDLATLRYRMEHFHADTVVYVTDGRQQLHFQQLFATARKWGIPAQLEHVWFGAILGPDRKPLKTRDGTPIRLRDLLDEAEERAVSTLRIKRPDMEESQAVSTAKVIGIGAIKYADLSQNRNLDYQFDWEKLLSFEGNTAPYLLNAYVRTRSILRKAGSSEDQLLKNPRFELSGSTEADLARKLLALGDIVRAAAGEFRPHLLCNYLYETAALYHRFFEHCPVLKAETKELQESRLALCALTGRILRRGMELLGIHTVEEM